MFIGRWMAASDRPLEAAAAEAARRHDKQMEKAIAHARGGRVTDEGPPASRAGPPKVSVPESREESSYENHPSRDLPPASGLPSHVTGNCRPRGALAHQAVGASRVEARPVVTHVAAQPTRPLASRTAAMAVSRMPKAPPRAANRTPRVADRRAQRLSSTRARR
jgi:hypothetical protein